MAGRSPKQSVIHQLGNYSVFRSCCPPACISQKSIKTAQQSMTQPPPSLLQLFRYLILSHTTKVHSSSTLSF